MLRPAPTPRLLKRLLRLTLLSVLCIGACTKVGPDFSAPPSDVAQHWLESDDPKLTASTPTYTDWWNVFDDAVLNKLIQIAYQQNLPLRIAGIRVLEARASLGVAIGQFYPQTQQGIGSLNFNRYPPGFITTSQTGESGSGAVNYWESNIGLALSWELDFWGKFRRAIQSADMRFLSSVTAYDAALVSLIGDVASSYVLIRTLEERLKIARDNVIIQKESLKIAEARFRGGATSERDVQQALTQLNSTEATIPQLTISLQQARNSLSVLLGTTPAKLGDMLSSPAPIPKAPLQVAVGIPADLLRRRPDIRSAEYQAAAQCAQIGIAKADLYPAFSLSGNIGFSALDLGQAALGDMFSWSNRTGTSLGPSFQWNLFNYGRITNNVRLQDARFEALLVNYQNVVLKAQQEVEDGLVAFLKSQQKAESLTLSARAAKRSVDLAMIQYREGATDYTTVLTAQQALLLQEDNLAVTQGEIPQSVISLYRALGGGWEIRKGKDFIPEETRQAMTDRTNWGGLLKPDGTETAEPAQMNNLFQPPDW